MDGNREREIKKSDWGKITKEKDGNTAGKR